MVLVDTSVWIDHLRRGDAVLSRLLATRRVLGHPAVVGELALGNLKRRALLHDLTLLPQATQASDAEVITLIERHQLWGRGIGYIDTHLLAAARLSSTTLWTKDRRLTGVAAELGVAFAHSAWPT